MALASALAAVFAYHVAIADAARPVAQIELQLPGEGPARLCLERSRPARHLSGLERAQDDETCFLAPERRVRYTIDLAATGGRSHDPDDVMLAEGGAVFNAQSILLLPDEPRDADVVIEVSLPAGATFAAPFEKDGERWRTTARQVRCGAYLAIGKLRALGEVAAPSGGSLLLFAFGAVPAAGDAGLRDWLGPPFEASAKFWHGLPQKILCILVPVDEGDEGGVFGSVLREERPSLVLWYGARTPAKKFAGGWVAFHELFHLGQPPLAHRVPWFTEGSATYYQTILRSRSGALPAAEMWSDLADMAREHCDFDEPLADASRALRKTHHFREVYWGGACACLRIDLSIRARSAGRRSLDDELRALVAAGKEGDLTEEALLAHLDAATGGLASKAVQRKPEPIGPLLQSVDEKTRQAIFGRR